MDATIKIWLQDLWEYYAAIQIQNMKLRKILVLKEMNWSNLSFSVFSLHISELVMVIHRVLYLD